LDQGTVRGLALAHAIEHRANVRRLVINHRLGNAKEELGVRLFHLLNGYHIKLKLTTEMH
jgi:hypothetical protein